MTPMLWFIAIVLLFIGFLIWVWFDYRLTHVGLEKYIKVLEMHIKHLENLLHKLSG